MMSMKPFRYAVAQVNIEATIKTLSFLDNEGCAAIRALSATAKSLVFVHAVRPFSFITIDIVLHIATARRVLRRQ